MATSRRGRRKARPEEELEAEEVETAPAVSASSPEMLEQDLLGELEDDESRYVVQVWRRVDHGTRMGKLEYIARTGVAEFSLDSVRDRWGGGAYEFRVLRRDDRGSEKYYRTTSKLIAGPPRTPDANGLPPGGPVAVVPAPASEELRLIREEVARSRRLNARLRRELEERGRTTPLEWIKELAPILAPFLKPARSSGGGDDGMKWLELGMKLAERAGEGPDPLGGFLKDVTPAFVNALTDGKANGAASSSSETAPVVRGPQNNGAAIAGNIAQHKLAPVWLQRAQLYLGVLLAWARAGEDPAACVERVLTAIDAETLEELGTASESPAFVTNTLAALPPVFRQPDVVTWTTRFLQLLQDKLAPEEEEAPRPAPKKGKVSRG